MDGQVIQRLRKENPFMPLQDIIHEILLQEIVTFQLLPGSKITQSHVAKTLGVSRSPVNAALQRLAKNQYVEKSGAYRVASFSEKECKDMMELAVQLEAYAAGRAVMIMTDKQLDELYELAYLLQKKGWENTKRRNICYCSETIELERQFHRKIICLADHPLLLAIYDQIKYRLFRYRSYLMYNPPKGYYSIVSKDHLIICDVLKLRNKVMAEAVVQRHVSFAENFLKDIMDKRLYMGNEE
ncbi:GntR family transcriptional regulator [Anaeroglobus geminatus]|uniref:FCD domain protein n=1 Tax=Anaeroglobus geminatus F0357 TaxID=861450 RepID=G9YIY3_9FIRM|nr:GntR family transcriptional regulator [Anaeroglobus geminatus]EHM39276.1 FCD domain protein [Anaeroglobus geminatus F0357]